MTSNTNSRRQYPVLQLTSSHHQQQMALQSSKSTDVPPNPKQSNRVVLNVGGVRHEVLWKTLDRLPHTRLGKLRYCTTHEALMELCDDYCNNTAEMEFFFDRQPRSFSSILNFYQTGKLHLADDVCILSFKDDLEYWNIDEQYLDPCCQNKYHHRKDRILEELSSYAKIAVEDFGTGCCVKWRRIIWNLLEKPHTSKAALLLTILSILFIIVSILSLMASTFPSFKSYSLVDGNMNDDENGSMIIIDDENGHMAGNDIFTIIEGVCVAWFTLEFILRVWASPSKLAFIKDPMNIIDLLANISYYNLLILRLSPKGTQGLKDLLRIIQVFRIFRLVKLTRYSTGLNSLGQALKRSWKEMGLLVMFLVIAVVVFSTLVYFTEKDEVNNNFNSIPDALWWALVTMTTVGYGDILPVSAWGRLVGTGCCICGILFIVLPIPILVNNFRECYSEQMRHMEAVKRREAHDRAKGSGDIASPSAVNVQFANGGGGGVGSGGGGDGGGVGSGGGDGGGIVVVGGGGGVGHGGKDPAAVLITSYPFKQATYRNQE